MSGQLPWYVARSAGLISWALLTASVLWGLALSGRTMRKWAKPSWILDLHRFLGGLTIVFVLVHVSALLLDTYVHFGLVQLLMPLATSWHPLGVAWGITGLYLLAAVEVTSLLRGRLRRKVWKRTHYATLPLFVVATAHGFNTGTDRANMAVIFIGVAGVVAVAFLGCRRLARKTSVMPAARKATPRLSATEDREHPQNGRSYVDDLLVTAD